MKTITTKKQPLVNSYWLMAFSLFAYHSSLISQNIAINATGNQADPSAMLDVASTSAGVLIPRMNTTQRNAITSPAVGLQVFNTDCNELNYWNGACWISSGSIPAPHPITSNTSTALCAAVTATYSVPAVTGATGYNWSVPAGATINSGQGTTSVSVTFGNYSGQICAMSFDACETSNPTCIDVNISPIPPTPGNITGLSTVNPGQNMVTYFIASVSGAGVYNWSVPSGATITAGVGTPAITVNFSCSAVSGNVSVTAGSNCGTSSPSVLAVTVTPLIINAGSAVFGGTAIGGSPTASGGQTPYTYSWSPNSNLSSSTVANPTALCSGSTTTYSITVTDFNGCSASSSVIVARNLAANAGSAVLSGNPIGGSPTATGGVSPYTYSWSPNYNLSSYTVANPTALCSGSTITYTVTVTDAHGCLATSSVLVTWNLAANAGANVTICPGNSAPIGPASATGGNSSSYSYSWNPIANLTSPSTANPTASPTSTTTYSVTITDANGCTATSSMILTVNNPPVSTFTNSAPTWANTSLTFTPTTTSGVTYSWTFSGGSPGTSSVQNPSVTWGSTGTYTVSLTVTSNSTGCYSTTTNTLTVTNPTIVTFTSSTSWTVPTGVTAVEVLVVGGGGGGTAGGSYGGGGGGGAVVYNSAYSVSPGTINVTVGGGGSTSGSGGSSAFGSITAAGGGAGGAPNGGTSGNGYSGGTGTGCGNANVGGGGGGAGGAGGNGVCNIGGGAGGIGFLDNAITGSYYGGGGGGGCQNYSVGSYGGAGGTGGGGKGYGVSTGASVAGTANTGGGGGGSDSSGGPAAAGGSGIVVIKY